MRKQKEENSTGRKNPPIQTILDIWNALAAHASPEAPITISQLADHVEADCHLSGGSAVSKKTVTRYLPQNVDAVNALCPHTVLCEEGEPAILHTYTHGDTLHVVMETPDGQPEWSGDMTAVLTPSATAPIPVGTLNRRLPKLMEQFGEADGRNPPLISLAGVMMKNSAGGQRTYIPALRHGLDPALEGETADRTVSPEDMQRKEGRSPTRRYYLKSLLSAAEWRILSDLIRVYPYIDERQTEKFLSVIQRMAPGMRDWSGERCARKAEAGMQFQHIKVLDRAIREQRLASVTYGRYQLGVNDRGQLWPQLQPMPDNKHTGRPYVMTVEPYAMMWSNGYYYLVCKQDGSMRNLRLDRVLHVEIQTQTFEKDPDFDACRYRDRSPVMYPGDPADICLRCPLSLLSTLMDFFGTAIRGYTTPREPDSLPPSQRYTEVSLKASESGTRLFALQYADQVEVLCPPSLREDIRDTLLFAAEKYQLSDK